MASLLPDQYKVLQDSEDDLYLLHGLALHKSDLLKATLVALRKDTLTNIVSKVAGHVLPMELQMQIVEVVVVKDYENMPCLTASMEVLHKAGLNIFFEGSSEPSGVDRLPTRSRLLLRDRMKAKLREIEAKLGASFLQMTDLFPRRYKSGRQDTTNIVVLTNLKHKGKLAGTVSSSDVPGNHYQTRLHGHISNLLLWDHCYLRVLGLPDGQVRPHLTDFINQIEPTILEQARQSWIAHSSNLHHPSFGDLVTVAMDLDKFQSQPTFIVVAKIHTRADCIDSKRQKPEHGSVEDLGRQGGMGV